MKRCTYCGKEYPGEATVCAVDGGMLTTITPTSQKRIQDGKEDGPCSPSNSIPRAKSLWIGIFAFGLIIWPIILLQLVWAAHRANVHYVPPQFGGLWAMSWLAGFFVAICGFFVGKGDPPILKFIGRALCVIALFVQIACIYWAISEFKRAFSNAI